MQPLHTPKSVLSMRHFPSWILLASAAGCVNAIGFFACARFVAHVSGNATSFGTGMAALDVAEDYGLVLLCFILGAMLGGTLIDGRNQQKRKPLYALPLLLVVVMLCTVATMGILGVFGEFSGSVDGIHDLIFVAMLAFAMGLQNSSVASSTGLMVRTTHMTGPATDLGVQLATALHAQGDARKMALKQALLRFTKIASFTTGAALGVPLAMFMKYGAFFVPAAFVLVATVASFLPRTAADAPEGFTGTAKPARDAA